MEIINRRQRMVSVARKVRREQDKTIGLVPTMGALHEGHLSLVQEARRVCDIVVVSIFVNPAQFAPHEDFEKYPRDLAKDAARLTDFNVDYIFAPAPEEIYPPNFSTYVNLENFADQLEGRARPGHFRGVATVVAILFNLVRPDFAYFGQKDAQQTIVIKRMARDLAFSTEVVVLPTLREDDGLAMSSRNVYLDAEQRAAAPVIYRALMAARELYIGGERKAARLIAAVRDMLQTEPAAQLEYVNLNDNETLAPLEKLDDERPALLSLAARFGKTRLIDNLILAPNRKGTTGSFRVPQF